MSKEVARQIVMTRFADFTGLAPDRKAYPNQPKRAYPSTGFYASLEMEFITHEIRSIAEDPCTERGGVVVIEVSCKLDTGTKGVTELTDALEDWFALKTLGKMWTSAANTVYNGEDKSRTRYIATVYIPFYFDESP